MKLLKIFIIIVASLFLFFSLLYIFGPYLIKNRMGGEDAVAIGSGSTSGVGKGYMGIEALPKNGRILFVTAHADDLEFMAGGTLPYLLERGNKVYLVILTNGGKQRYMPGFYSKAIIKTRREDQIKVAKAEGLTKVFFENHKDGYLEYSEEALEEVERVAKDNDATDIFTFEPGKRQGYYDSDHDSAGKIGTALAKEKAKGLYYFRASSPNIVVDITETFERKIDILFMFTEFTYKKRMMRAMHAAWATSDGKRIGVKYGEVFERVKLDE